MMIDANAAAVQQQLAYENEEMFKALEVMRKQLEIKIGERNQISSLYEDHKQHYEAMRQRLTLAERRLAEEAAARRDLEFT